MSSATCCMSRKPSSPHSLATRPVQAKPPQGSSLASIRCHEPDSPYFASSSTVSVLSRAEDVAELQAIFEEDKSSFVGEKARPRAKRSSSSLISLKDRLRKHLSRELRVHKRHSRSSVGTSEEEVERRVELRRIQHKRIQEELVNDVVYDSDAKSLPTIGGLDSAYDLNGEARSSRYSWSLPMMISPPILTSAFSSPYPTFPYLKERGSPLKPPMYGLPPAEEYSLSRTPRPQSEPDPTVSSNVPNTWGISRSRRYSSLDLVSPEADHDAPDMYQSSRRRSSVPQIPSALDLKPHRLPNSLFKSSWRLSFASESRGVHLRGLSQDGPFTAPVNDFTTQQPVNRWLQSQHPRSTSQAFTWSEDKSNDGLSISHPRTGSTYQIDGPDVSPESTLHEWRISQCEAPHLLQRSSHSEYLINLEGGSNFRDASCDSDPTNTTGSMKSVGPLAQEPSPGMMPIFARLARLEARSYDGSIEKMINIPPPPSPVAITPYAENGERTTVHLNHLVGDEVAGEWKKAVYLNTHYQDVEISHILALPRSKKLYSCQEIKEQSQLSDGLDSKDAISHCLEKDEAYNDSNLPTSTEKKEVSDNNMDKNSKLDRRYPASWSRFSSHDRADRTVSAGAEDHVAQIDFAVAGVQDSNAVWCVNERSNHLYHHKGDNHESHRNPTKKGFFESWDKGIKDKLYQLESVQTDVFLDRTRGSRGTLAKSMPVEYPELELLPGDMMTVAQIEAYAKKQKEEEEMKRQKEELQTIFTTEIEWRGAASRAKRESRASTERYHPKETPPAKETIELDYLTPTKSIAERREARKSRQYSREKHIRGTSSKMARQLEEKPDTESTSKQHPQVTSQARMKGKVREGGHVAVEDRMTVKRASSKTPSGSLDGAVHFNTSFDSEHEDEYLEGSPADCIVTAVPDQEHYCRSGKSMGLTPSCLEKGGFGTWCLGDWVRPRDSSATVLSTRRPLSLGNLRQSTDDFHSELKKMERFETEKALRIVQVAWGDRQ